MRAARHPLGRAVTSLGVGLWLVLGAALLPAQAHDRLVDTSPADGETLTSAPRVVTLTFSEAPVPVNPEIEVTDASGRQVTTGKTTIEGTTVTRDLLAELASGKFRVRWAVTAGDGHPVQGELSFTLDLPEPSASPAPSASRAPSASPTARVSPAPVTPAPVGTRAPAVGEAAPQSSAVLPLVLAGAALVLAGVTMWVWRRRR